MTPHLVRLTGDPATRAAAAPAVLEQHLLAVAAGDRLAFSHVYDATASRVHGLVLRVLRDVHQAEEVTQEVFVEIWQSAGRFDPARGSAYSWMLTLAHRRAVDRVRQSEAGRRRDREHVERTHETPYDETAHSALASLDAQIVRNALATLLPPQREALELAYFGGHSHAEVSRLTRVPLGTAKSRIRDGLIRLRAALAETMPEPAAS